MYLHHHKNFKDLLLAESEARAIDPILIEKDYWIMHCLYGLKTLGFRFELKGGTSLGGKTPMEYDALPAACFA